MFLSADILVKVIMLGLIFASLVTWALFLAKTILLAQARKATSAALAHSGNVRSQPVAGLKKARQMIS